MESIGASWVPPGLASGQMATQKLNGKPLFPMTCLSKIVNSPLSNKGNRRKSKRDIKKLRDLSPFHTIPIAVCRSSRARARNMWSCERGVWRNIMMPSLCDIHQRSEK